MNNLKIVDEIFVIQSFFPGKGAKSELILVFCVSFAAGAGNEEEEEEEGTDFINKFRTTHHFFISHNSSSNI